jgi:hypothetical protein
VNSTRDTLRVNEHHASTVPDGVTASPSGPQFSTPVSPALAPTAIDACEAWRICRIESLPRPATYSASCAASHASARGWCCAIVATDCSASSLPNRKNASWCVIGDSLPPP